MTMGFRVVKDALIATLGENSGGNFVTIGHQRQSRDAEEVLDLSRSVQCFYKSGDFPKDKGTNGGSTRHEALYRIELTVSKAAGCDLSVISNAESTEEEMMVALENLQESSELADQSIDELFDIIYQILMSPANYDLGLDIGTVTNRWIGTLKKDNPMPRGEYVILTGEMTYNCSIPESVDGEIPVYAGAYYSNTIIIGDDELTVTSVDVFGGSEELLTVDDGESDNVGIDINLNN